jgi:hypothetical protein
VLADFAADGVVYLELRTTPRAMPGAGMSEADYVGVILEAVAEFEGGGCATAAGEEGGGEGGGGLRTGLILSVGFGPVQFFSFCVVLRDRERRGLVFVGRLERGWWCGEILTGHV